MTYKKWRFSKKTLLTCTLAPENGSSMHTESYIQSILKYMITNEAVA